MSDEWDDIRDEQKLASRKAERYWEDELSKNMLKNRNELDDKENRT